MLAELAAAAVDELPDGEMPHALRCRGAVPVEDAGRRPHDVAGPDDALLLAPRLHPADSGRDDQILTGRMIVPGGPRAGLETDLCCRQRAGIVRLKQEFRNADAGVSPVGSARGRALFRRADLDRLRR